MPATPRLALPSILLLTFAATAAAQPWPASGLAIRTNGSSFRDGECVRVSLLALDDVPGPLAAQVRYEFQQTLTVKNQNGQESSFRRPAVVDRPAGLPQDYFPAGSALVLDDTFCFGVGSGPGPYQVSVALSTGGTATGSLTTCVEFQADTHGGPGPTTDRCEYGLRSVSRRDDTNVLTLEGQFPPSGLFRLAFLRGERIVHLMEGGLLVAGPGELSFVVPSLGPDGAGQVDLLLQDQLGSRATTLAGVWLQR